MRNIEALRNYFLGKDPQLEVVLSDNSLRLSGIEGKHYILRGELIKRLTDLKTAMEDADTVLQNNIDAEALTRGQADNTLQGNIDAEALARQNADNALESKMPFKKLTQDITIPENSELNPLLLSTGWWYTGEHVINYGENENPTIYNNALFYFNAEAGDQWFYFLPPNLDDGWNQLGTYLWFDNTDHIWQYSGYGVVTIIDNHSTDVVIPTAGAVYEFVKSNGAGIKALTSPVTIWNLEDGVYLLPASCEVRYGGGTYWPASVALLFVGTESATTKRYFIFDGTGTQNTITNGKATENSGTIKYFSVGLDYEVAANKTATAPNSQSTDTQYPTSKAVYDFGVNNFIGNNVITDIWHGTQAQYEQISPKSATTLYLIDEE